MAGQTTSAKPDATSQTKPNNKGGTTSVPVTPKRTVTYVVKATSSSNLSIPYAVAVDGAAQAAFSSKPKRVSGASGKVTVFVDQGQKVSLFLNSDAHPSYRKNPVYEVTAGERDILVTVTEKKGKHTDADTPTRQTAKDVKAEAAKTADEYTAPLTGDIWMKVSHKYTASEVEALIPAGTSAEATASIKKIYDGLSAAMLTVTLAATKDTAGKTLSLTFQDSNNPKDNVSNYTLLGDGLPRVHPGGYAALIQAALDNDISSMIITSCWRPLLGSIAHRAGLGLDVNYVGKTRMNRQELRNAFEGKKPSKKGDGDDNDNVTNAEVAAFGEYEDAIAANRKAQSDLAAAQKALEAANKTKDAGKIAAALEARKSAAAAATAAVEAEARTREAWGDERDANEPTSVRTFRASLLRCSCVKQLFDPWFMATNALDNQAPEPNVQITQNETLHAHHLHITVHEPKIL